MRIMAIGDLNNDKQSDLVTAIQDKTALKTWYFNQSSYKYDQSADLTLPSGLKVDSVIVTKGQDPLTGLQHLLVTASDASSTQLLLYKQQVSAAGYSWSEMTNSNFHGTKILKNSQPMVLDANADQA